MANRINRDNWLEEYRYLQTELQTELEGLFTSVKSGLVNLQDNRFYRLNEMNLILKSGRITQLTERLLCLEKFLKQLDEVD